MHKIAPYFPSKCYKESSRCNYRANRIVLGSRGNGGEANYKNYPDLPETTCHRRRSNNGNLIYWVCFRVLGSFCAMNYCSIGSWISHLCDYIVLLDASIYYSNVLKIN